MTEKKEGGKKKEKKKAKKKMINTKNVLKKTRKQNESQCKSLFVQ